MPINKKDYPANWAWLSRQVRARNNQRCELCNAANGKPHWLTKSKVVLTVHHIDSNKQNNSERNLIALCQRCHLRLDLEKHINNRKKRRDSALLESGETGDNNGLPGTDVPQLASFKKYLRAFCKRHGCVVNVVDEQPKMHYEFIKELLANCG